MQRDSSSAEDTRKPAAQAPRAPVEETDIEAVAKVRELLFGDAVRSLREEVLSNHTIMVNKFDKLVTDTEARLERLGGKLASFNALFEAAMAAQEDELAQLSEHSSRTEAELQSQLEKLQAQATPKSEFEKLRAHAVTKAELEKLTDAFCETTGKLRKDLHQRVNAQSAALLASEQRLLGQLASHAEMLKQSQVGKDDFAKSLRSIAEQLSEREAKAHKPVAVGGN